MKSKEEVFSIEEIQAIIDLKERAKTIMWKKVPASVSKYGILSGGCFASWYHREPVKDFDIFFLDTSEIQDWKEDVMLQFQTIRKLSSKGGYSFSDSSIIDVYNYSHFAAEADCQFIFTKYKTRQELLASFDYEHAKLSFCASPSDINEGILYVTKEAIESIRAKTLVRTKSPHTSEKRLEKLLGRGWIRKTPNVPILSYPTSNVVVASGGSGWDSIEDIIFKISMNEDKELKTYQQTYQQKMQELLDAEAKKLIGVSQKVEQDKNWHEKLMERLARPWDF